MAPPPDGALAERADPRLMTYLAAAFVSLISALVTGRYELVALGAPFAALAAVGLADRAAPNIRGRINVDNARVLEGDEINGEIILDWDGEVELDAMLTSLRGAVPVDPAPVPAWALPRTHGPVALPFRLRAQAWGRHELCHLWVQARRWGGLLVWEGKVAIGPDLRVLPAPMRLNRLLRPLEPRTVAGAHLSRQRGSGTDFAELRPYVPGDRLRDLSWAASARAGEPWVIVHHPERTGTVLLLLDAFFENDRTSRAAFARAAQAAWAVAAAHLRVQDRVGLMAVGRTTAWMPPRSGQRARWLLLDELLAVGRDAEEVRYRGRRSRPAVPHDALVVGITSLHSSAFINDLVRHRRMGHTTVALVIDMRDLVPAAGNLIEHAAHRLWRAQRELERQQLQRSGVPTALVTADGVAPAISLLRNATSRQHRGTAGARAR
jgi:uncharacterized protein (DUF58 family)